jgi:hypothetical protein
VELVEMAPPGTLTLVIDPEPAVGLARLRYRLDRLVARS